MHTDNLKGLPFNSVSRFLCKISENTTNSWVFKIRLNFLFSNNLNIALKFVTLLEQ